MNKSTKIEWKPIDELIPYEHNAKKHTKTQIANLKTSFEKFGWQNPVLIDENNVIICGHGRCLGAREAGMTEAPCIVCKDLSEDEIRDYRHLDNLLSEGDYIQDEFNIDLPDLSDFDFSEIDINIDLDGITIDELTEYDDEEELFDDIEKLEHHYGVPYRGNKSRIADIIIHLLPSGERLVDLFGGGGSDNSLCSSFWQMEQLFI